MIFFGDPINHKPVGTPKKCTKMLTSIYIKTNHSRMPMKLTQIFSEENQSHRARFIPIGANRRRCAPKKLLSGLRYQPIECVNFSNQKMNFFKFFKCFWFFFSLV